MGTEIEELDRNGGRAMERTAKCRKRAERNPNKKKPPSGATTATTTTTTGKKEWPAEKGGERPIVSFPNGNKADDHVTTRVVANLRPSQERAEGCLPRASRPRERLALARPLRRRAPPPPTLVNGEARF